MTRDPDAERVRIIFKDRGKINFLRLKKKLKEFKARRNLNLVLRNGKALFLAYDQGLEHGPTDFNDKNANPDYIIDIAKKGNYNCLIFQKGIAEKYRGEIRKSNIPLIIKLNGKTNLVKGEPVSRQICDVDEAINLGASGVGYTIYIGSEHEQEMFEEFADIVREAHSKGLFVVAWVYPRGKSIRNKKKTELMAYACRVGLELGADIIKIKYEGKKKDLEWAVKNAGKARVVVAGGVKKGEKDLLKQVKEIIGAGCAGLAIGRNVWQAKDPINITKKLKKVIWK
jgi:fructose-bisphosphate aldolase, class I